MAAYLRMQIAAKGAAYLRMQIAAPPIKFIQTYPETLLYGRNKNELIDALIAGIIVAIFLNNDENIVVSKS